MVGVRWALNGRALLAGKTTRKRQEALLVACARGLFAVNASRAARGERPNAQRHTSDAGNPDRWNEKE